jgi:hypothetical protein
VVGCQVTNLTAQSMEIRCLMGSPDSGKAFDLQCLVREEMMEWVKANYPEAYPNMRYRAVGEADKTPSMQAINPKPAV